MDVNLGGDGSDSKLGGETPFILWKLELVGRRLRGAEAHLPEQYFIEIPERRFLPGESPIWRRVVTLVTISLFT